MHHPAFCWLTHVNLPWKSRISSLGSRFWHRYTPHGGSARRFCTAERGDDEINQQKIVRDWRTSTWCPDVPTCQPTRLIMANLRYAAQMLHLLIFPWEIVEINGGKWSNSADFLRHVWRRILLLHFCFKRLSCFKKLCIQSALATEFNSLSHLKPFQKFQRLWWFMDALPAFLIPPNTGM